MSFSKEIKEELSKINSLSKKEEALAEFLGYITSNNTIEMDEKIKYTTENDYNINRYAKLVRTIGIENFKIDISGNKFFIEINKKFINKYKFDYAVKDIEIIKAFVRGIFMGAGSVNNPENKYHLECGIRCTQYAIKIKEMLKKLDINIKNRENIIYIKEGEEISKFLAFIGANKSVLKFEEIRVKRYMNGKVNRLVNCESANLNKVLNASIEQVNAIKKLKKMGEYKKLDKSLKEIAELRLKYPDISLIELGQKLTPPLGKSGVNYRLQKLVKMVDKSK